MAKKRKPSLENYLTTGKVHWDGEPTPLPEKKKEKKPPAPEVFKKQSLSEKEIHFLSMLEEEEKTLWGSRLLNVPTSFYPLHVMDERKAFERGERKGSLFKLRRRKSSLEKIYEEKDIAFPLLALIEVTENAISVWSNHIGS
ncbi:MAG TPA: hypothetical protein PLA80_01580 [Synergistaceae bacterium]|nr:hypothetical protein [Synergistaceae bacterium]